jgi:hypothetical protein
MAEEIVEITIGPDGKLQMHVSGVPGMDCVAVHLTSRWARAPR